MTTLFQDNQNDLPQIDLNKNYYEELVGEGKKFKDNEALAKGKFYADQMIEHKNKEYDALREDFVKLRDEYNAGKKLEEYFDQFKTLQTNNSSTSDNTPNANENMNNTPAFELDKLDSLVSSKIQEHERSRREEANFQEVQNKLSEKLGSNAKQILRTQMEEMGLTEDFVNDLARKNPKVFYRTFGLDQAQRQNETFNAPPSNEKRVDSFAPTGHQRSWSYYQKIKRDDPVAYTSIKIQNQMLKDATELGDKFYDGDWSAY